MSFSIWEFFSNQVQPVLETANIYLGVISAGAAVWAAIAASRARKQAKRAADAAVSRVVEIDLVGELLSAMDLVNEVTILQNGGKMDELPSKYDALILKWQQIQANRRIITEGEAGILETGIERLLAVKTLILEDNPSPSLAYLDNIMKDRAKEMIAVLARLRGRSDA